MMSVAKRIQTDKLSVRRTEEIVREYGASPVEPEPYAAPEPNDGPEELQHASRTIQDALGLPVRVRPFRRGGKLEIRFREVEELEELVRLLVPPDESDISK